MKHDNKTSLHIDTETEAPDMDQVAANLESIIGEPVLGVMTSHGATLLLMWHESWQALNAPRLDGLEAVQLNTELLQIGRIMEACMIISSNAVNQLNFAIYSLTEHHMRDQRRNPDGDYVIELHLQGAGGNKAGEQDNYVAICN